MSGLCAPLALNEPEASCAGIFVEHLHRFERVLLQVLSEQLYLRDDVRGCGNNMTAAILRLDDIENFAGLAHNSSAPGSGFRISADSVIILTGSTPVSAMRPANTETIVRAPGSTAVATSPT